MCAHDDEVSSHRLRRAQDAVERIAANDQRPAGDLPQFRHRSDLFVEDAFGLARFERNQILRLIVVHHVDEGQFRPVLVRQETCPSHGALGPGREIRRCQKLHVRTSSCLTGWAACATLRRLSLRVAYAAFPYPVQLA
jgi:hypothetical protein